MGSIGGFSASFELVGSCEDPFPALVAIEVERCECKKKSLKAMEIGESERGNWRKLRACDCEGGKRGKSPAGRVW